MARLTPGIFGPAPRASVDRSPSATSLPQYLATKVPRREEAPVREGASSCLPIAPQEGCKRRGTPTLSARASRLLTHYYGSWGRPRCEEAPASHEGLLRCVDYRPRTVLSPGATGTLGTGQRIAPCSPRVLGRGRVEAEFPQIEKLPIEAL